MDTELIWELVAGRIGQRFGRVNESALRRLAKGEGESSCESYTSTVRLFRQPDAAAALDELSKITGSEK